MATSYLDNSYLYNLQIDHKNAELPPHDYLASSPITPASSSIDSPVNINDFYIDHDPTSPVAKLCKDPNSWTYAVSQLRQQIFNSTSTAYSTPVTYLLEKAGLNNNTLGPTPLGINNSFSSDPLTYRKGRSEDLLVRMIHCKDLDMNKVSLMRLQTGVFVHQKCQSSTLNASPTLSAITESLNTQSGSSEASIDTFQFDTVCHMANRQTQSCYDTFVPYSYTFGARYTNPYSDVRDLAIRGKLPLWCQTVFLNTCLKSTIKPDVPIYGMFPFAPHVPVTFHSLENYSSNLILPELTLLYEKFTMEHFDPSDLANDNETKWQKCKKDIVRNMLACNIDDNLANALNDMASAWATSQGLML